MIALALTCDPQVLIADEPTTALDVMVQAQILELLTDIARERSMAVRHHQPRPIGAGNHLSTASPSCMPAAIVEEGVAREVFDYPKHPYTRALTGAFPTIGDPESRYAPSGLAGDPPFPGDLPEGARSIRAVRTPSIAAKKWTSPCCPPALARRAACILVNEGVAAS